MFEDYKKTQSKPQTIRSLDHTKPQKETSRNTIPYILTRLAQLATLNYVKVTTV